MAGGAPAGGRAGLLLHAVNKTEAAAHAVASGTDRISDRDIGKFATGEWK
jgi:hypothetical protein